MEYRLLARDGRTVWIRNEASLVWDGRGRRRFWQGFMLDITAEKGAQDALRASERRLSTALTAAHTVSWEWDIATGRLTWSENAEAVFRVPIGAVGRTHLEFLDLVHPDDRAWLSDVDDEVVTFENGSAVEYRIVGRDGRARWFSDRGRVLSRGADRRARQASGVTMDITERRTAEAALHESEARFRSLVQNASDMVTVLDADGRVAYDSPAVAQVLGYDPADLLGTDPFTRIHEEDAPAVRERLAWVLRNPAETARASFRFRHQDGSWRWMDAVGSNLLDDPHVAGVVVNTRDVTARVEAEARYRTLVEQIPAITYVDEIVEGEPGERTFISPQIEAILGWSPQECIDDPDHWVRTIHPDDRDRVRAEDQRTNASGDPFDVEYRQRGRDGRYRWLHDRAVLVRDETGRPSYWHGIQFDITERKEAEAALREGEERFRLLSDAAFEGIAVHDAGIILDVNRRYAAMFGYDDPSELAGRPVLDDVAPESRVAVMDRVAARIEGRHEMIGLRRDGTTFPVEAQGRVIPYRGGTARVTALRDLSERKAAEARLRHLAFHDPLTGLPNRALFAERLAESLGRRPGKTRVAVLFLDLDGFKLVNDSHGHEAGDRLLIAAGLRLAECVGGAATLARFGGDEFAVLLPRVADADEAGRRAERMLRALRAPFAIRGREVYVNASVGIATGVPGVAQAGDLQREADTALYRAKAAGRGTFAVFEPEMWAPVVERLERETALRRAVERGELRLHYQPLVELATGRSVGVEALVRWAHPEHGLLGPSGFIHQAEETGLIVALGRWALEEACRRARTWRAAVDHPAPAVSVNLSSRQFQEVGLADDVATVLRKTGLPADRLELEITETVAMGYGSETGQTLAALKSLGGGLAIDDFGTGYSSLGHLSHLAVDGLKLDRSFVSGLGVDAGSLAIARAVATLAQDLGLRVTAEGIENADQAALLRGLGVERGQGYHFARPLADGAIDALLARRPRLPEGDHAGASANPSPIASADADADADADALSDAASSPPRPGRPSPRAAPPPRPEPALLLPSGVGGEPEPEPSGGARDRTPAPTKVSPA